MRGMGIGVERLVFLPIGNDAASWSYRVEASASSYFLKVRVGAGSMPGATVSGYLGALGVADVMAPLPAADGASYVVVEELAVALYPLVEARTAMEAGLTAGSGAGSARWCCGCTPRRR